MTLDDLLRQLRVIILSDFFQSTASNRIKLDSYYAYLLLRRR